MDGDILPFPFFTKAAFDLNRMATKRDDLILSSEAAQPTK
jgi:hypothetical protein